MYIPIPSMYGIFTYIYHMFPLKTTIHVGKYKIPYMDGMYIIEISTQLSPFHWASNPSFSLPTKYRGFSSTLVEGSTSQ